jgi:GDPmannose 4,6-dehydratase
VRLDWRDQVESDASLLRPSEIMVRRANPDKSALILGRQATYRMKDVVPHDGGRVCMIDTGNICYE